MANTVVLYYSAHLEAPNEAAFSRERGPADARLPAASIFLVTPCRG